MSRTLDPARAIGAAVLLSSVALMGAAIAARGGRDVSPVFGVELPRDYRSWQVIGVAHEAGSLNDIRVVLGNRIAIKAYRQGRRPFPDGSILARIAWKLVPSERNNAIFGQAQSFVAGEPTNVQIEVKDSKRYASTNGWGYGQFDRGKANRDVALVTACNGCHVKLPRSEDLIFTPYSQ